MSTEDITGIRFTVLRKMTDTDILLNIHASNADVYKFLRVKVVRDSAAPSLIYKTRLGDAAIRVTNEINPGTLMFLPAIPLDDKSYAVHLESLSGSNVENKYVHLVANSTFMKVEFEYEVPQAPTEQLIKQTSVWTLMAVLITVLLCYNVKRIAELIKLQFQSTAIDSYFGGFRAKPTNGDFGSSRTDEDQGSQGVINAKRKLKARKI